LFDEPPPDEEDAYGFTPCREMLPPRKSHETYRWLEDESES
jgi:hypothetical protein